MKIKKIILALTLIFGVSAPFATNAGWIDDVFKAISLSAMIPEDACIRSVDGDIEGSSQSVEDERGLVPNLTELIVGGNHARCEKGSVCSQTGSGRIDGQLEEDKRYDLLVTWGDCTTTEEGGEGGGSNTLRKELQGLCSVFPSKLCNERGIFDFIAGVIRWALGLAGAIFLAMLVYGGFQYLIVGTSEKNIEKARNTITYAIIGIVVIAGAWLIADFVISMLTRGA